LVVVESPALSPDARILSFVTLGAALLAVSFIYTRLRSKAPPQ
jgi:hypothetical protein